MPPTDAHRGPEMHQTRRERTVPTFLVRRETDGECSPTCDFNQGRCLAGWRHPAGTVPWDPRCRDGDLYGLALVTEGNGWAAEAAG